MKKIHTIIMLTIICTFMNLYSMLETVTIADDAAFINTSILVENEDLRYYPNFETVRMTWYKQQFNDQKRKKHESINTQCLQALSCICLLLTPASWKHVVTIPYQQQLPMMEESDAEKFVQVFNNEKNNNLKVSRFDRFADKQYIQLPEKNQHVNTNQYDCKEVEQKRVGNLRTK